MRNGAQYTLKNNHNHATTVLRPFFRDHPGQPVPEENFWTLWCEVRLTEVDTSTIQMGANQCPPLPSPHFFTGWMPFLPPNQQCQSTEGINKKDKVKKIHIP